MADTEETPEEIEEPVEEIEDANAGLDEDEEVFATSGATEVKLFGKWSFHDIEVRDLSLEVSSQQSSTVIARF
jgi:hypothetical protein